MLRWASLVPKSSTEIGQRCGIAEMEKAHSTRPYLSSKQMKTQSDASNTGPVTVTETVSESTTAKRASCLWAFHDMTLSRSRLLILSDLSLKSRNRVVTVNNSQGREREPLKDDCLHNVSTPSLNKQNKQNSFGSMHGASLTAAISAHTYSISLFSSLRRTLHCLTVIAWRPLTYNYNH